MEGYNGFVPIRDSAMRPYTERVAEFCMPFSCDNHDLDEFFAKDAFLYNTELLGKTHAWISLDNPKAILGFVTLANDSLKSHNTLQNLLVIGYNAVYQTKNEDLICPLS